jgi:uncharacterized protein with PIN domain
MLGTLAKWLRIFGFDTYYANSKIDDAELLEIAKKENRILLTRDKELIYAGRRENLKIIKIKTTDLDEQLQLVLQNVKINKTNFLSRCTLCNTLLNGIKKEEVKNSVPKKVFENNEKFWFCSKCDKYYWASSHYDKMLKKIGEIKNIN